MNEPDYRGIAALTIALCGALGIFLVVPIAVLMGMTIGEAGSQVMVALGGALVGAFSVYMGMRHNGKEVLPTQKAPPKSAQEKANEPDSN